MVRRLKRDVLTQLPPKRREQVYIALDKKTDAYRELKGVQEQLQQLRDRAKADGLALGGNGGGDGISCSESLSVRLSQSIAAPRHQPRARAPESPSSSLASPTLASQANPHSASGIDGSVHDHFSPVSAWPQAAECGWR